MRPLPEKIVWLLFSGDELIDIFFRANSAKEQEKDELPIDEWIWIESLQRWEQGIYSIERHLVK